MVLNSSSPSLAAFSGQSLYLQNDVFHVFVSEMVSGYQEAILKERKKVKQAEVCQITQELD